MNHSTAASLTASPGADRARGGGRVADGDHPQDAGRARGGGRAAAKAQRRDAILSTAKELFARRGFHAVGIEDIGAGAGISGPAVYRHFASKEAILIELLVGISEYLHAGGQTLMAEAGGQSLVAEAGEETTGTGQAAGSAGAELVGRLIDFHIEFALREPELIRIQDRDFTALPDEARHRVRRLQRQYVTLWAQALRTFRPHLRDDEATVRVHAVIGMMNSTPYLARRIDSDVVRKQLLAGARASLGLG